MLEVMALAATLTRSRDSSTPTCPAASGFWYTHLERGQAGRRGRVRAGARGAGVRSSALCRCCIFSSIPTGQRCTSQPASLEHPCNGYWLLCHLHFSNPVSMPPRHSLVGHIVGAEVDAHHMLQAVLGPPPLAALVGQQDGGGACARGGAAGGGTVKKGVRGMRGWVGEGGAKRYALGGRVDGAQGGL